MVGTESGEEAGRDTSSAPAFERRTLPTVREVLEFDTLQRGRAEVVAGRAGLDATVRWVHVSELPGISELLRGNELILTTGIALPSERTGLIQYVTSLHAVGAAGLVFGLGPRYTGDLPPEIVMTAERLGLPVMVLRRTMRFVDITEDVHARIVDAQLDELRATEAIHSTFTEMAIDGAAPAEIVTQLARMAGQPVALENLSHQVLTYSDAGSSSPYVLEEWEARSRKVASAHRTVYDHAAGLLVAPVGARGEHWGRLVMVCSAEPLPRHRVMLERGAQALALSRLVTRDHEAIERQTHRTLLAHLLKPNRPVRELVTEAQALGVTLAKRRLTGIVLRTRTQSETLLDRQAAVKALAELAAEAVKTQGLEALVGPLDDSVVGVLLSSPLRADAPAAVDKLAKRLKNALSEQGLVVAVGDPVEDATEARDTLTEAMQVAEAAISLLEDRLVYRMPDLRLRGLLQWLRNDVRLQAFVERELAPLLEYDLRHGTAYVDMLSEFLMASRNKTVAAQRAHVSRPWMYECLAKIERILGVDLSSEEDCVSLQVALMGRTAIRGRADRP
ncbi:MAG: PucR family transcriptional regulator ligand-binding domain-containing protein [Nocardioidaceae bacterium]|nr:PucR family transcriptional regulator ligand-binding domain-containing protein [Nocardioidaceae bacterium]